MPQKRNPYALSIIRGASGTLIGRLDRLPRGDQEPVGPQRQPHLRLRRGAPRPRPRHADHAADQRRRPGPDRQQGAHVGGARGGFARPPTSPSTSCRPAGSTTAPPTRSGQRSARPRDGLRGVDLDGARLDAAAAEAGSPRRRSPSWTSRPRSTPRRSSGAGNPAGGAPRTWCARHGQGVRGRGGRRPHRDQVTARRVRRGRGRRAGRSRAAFSPASGGRVRCPRRARAACRWRCSAAAGSGRSRW